MGFFLFELLYWRQPWGFLGVLREEWETPATVEEAPASYMEALRKKLKATIQLAQAELGKAQ